MEKNEGILGNLQQILKDYANLEVQEFIRETTFIDLGINSVDFIKFIVGIETIYDFEFDDEDIQAGRFETMGELADFINSKIEESK
jgi:acyl carrier protein